MKRVLLGCLGAGAGYCVGYIVAVIVHFWLGNLIMPADVYQQKKSTIWLTHYSIVGIHVLAGTTLVLFGFGKLPNRSVRSTFGVMCIRVALIMFLAVFFTLLVIAFGQLAKLLRYLVGN